MVFMNHPLNLKIQKKTVSQSDTGRLVENTKARERMVLKELGKMTP